MILSHDPAGQRQRQQHQSRSITTTPQRANSMRPSRFKPSRKAQPSYVLEQKKAQQSMLQAGQIPDDVGLLPQTFILPSKMSERWSWKLRRRWVWARSKDIVGTVMTQFYFSPRPQLDINRLPGIAKDIYTRVFTAFAAGTPEAEQRLVCSGLLSSLQQRVAVRDPNSRIDWEIARWKSSPRVVSYRATMLPGSDKLPRGERSGIIQAVLRQRTVQKLQVVKVKQQRVHSRLINTAAPALGQPSLKENTEYVVLQKLITRGKVGPWMMWGFAQETTLESIAAEDGKLRDGKSTNAIPE